MVAKLLNLLVRYPRAKDEGDDELSAGPTPSQVAEALGLRHLPTDRAFDRFLADDLRAASRQYWTPLVVSLRVAEWLDELSIENVLDLGSGCGKFCVAAALASHASFVGLEERARLVAAARQLAERFGVTDRVQFVEGRFGTTPLPTPTAYYLYNPFGENSYERPEWLDTDVEHSEERFSRDIELVEGMLRQAPVGTYVITYNGFGGSFPATYDPIRFDRRLPNTLRLWRKTRAVDAGPPRPADDR